MQKWKGWFCFMSVYVDKLLHLCIFNSFLRGRRHSIVLQSSHLELCGGFPWWWWSVVRRQLQPGLVLSELKACCRIHGSLKCINKC